MQQRDMRSNASTTRSAQLKTVVKDSVVEDEEEYDDVWPTKMPTSTRRYAGLADVRTEVGRVPADVQVLSSQHTIRPRTKSTVPPRQSATQTDLPIIQNTPRRQAGYAAQPLQTGEIAVQHSRQLILGNGRPRLHWLVFVGLAMFTMLLGWVLLTMLANWWQVTQDDWHYGRPRTYQVDMVVGHADSVANPSHFIALNLHSHIEIIEFPGGDPSKAKVYVGPTLIGPGQDLTVVTLSFKDVNHTGKLSMIVNVQGSHFIFINENGQFRPARPNENVQY